MRTESLCPEISCTNHVDDRLYCEAPKTCCDNANWIELVQVCTVEIAAGLLAGWRTFSFYYHS